MGGGSGLVRDHPVDGGNDVACRAGAVLGENLQHDELDVRCNALDLAGRQSSACANQTGDVRAVSEVVGGRLLAVRSVAGHREVAELENPFFADIRTRLQPRINQRHGDVAPAGSDVGQAQRIAQCVGQSRDRRRICRARRGRARLRRVPLASRHFPVARDRDHRRLARQRVHIVAVNLGGEAVDSRQVALDGVAVRSERLANLVALPAHHDDDGLRGVAGVEGLLHLAVDLGRVAFGGSGCWKSQDDQSQPERGEGACFHAPPLCKTQSATRG